MQRREGGKEDRITGIEVLPEDMNGQVLILAEGR